MKPTLLLLMALALFLTSHHANAQVLFKLASSPNVGSAVSSITTADVNGDGKPDLIAVCRTLSKVVVFTNSGNGLFVSNASYAVGSNPNQVIAADINNDGWPDLITANDGNSLTLLTNDQNGGFVLAATITNASSQFKSVAAADVNGDGKLDLIAANWALNTITIWTNSGGGTFVSNATYSVGTAPPSFVTAADVNGDGKPDLLVASANKLSVLTNNGSVGFALASSPGAGSDPTWITAADVYGNGRTEFIVATFNVVDRQLLVFTNQGAGVLVSTAHYDAGSGTVAVVAVDVNGDGIVDLVAPYQSADLLVLTNSGTGVFGSNTTLAVDSGPVSVVAADVNGDGLVDLISGNSSAGTLTVLTNTGVFLPRLAFKRSGTNLIITWPASWANWTLQQNAGLDPADWISFGGPIGNNGAIKSATNSTSVGNRFFRLSYP